MSKAKNIEVVTESVSIDELRALRAENDKLKQEREFLKIACEKARTRKKAKVYRIESTKSASCFHLAFSQLFSLEYVESNFSDLIVSNNDDEIVFKKELRDKLLNVAQEALKKHI